MRELWTVIQFTYLNNLKSRTFIITTFITVLLIGILMSSNQLVNQELLKKEEHIGIVGTTNEILNEIKKANKEKRIHFYLFDTEEKAKESLKMKRIESYLIIKEEKYILKGIYVADELANQNQVFQLKKLLSEVKLSYGSQKLGIEENTIKEIIAPFDLKQMALKKEAKDEQTLRQSILIVFLLMFVIYMSVVFYGSTITVEVASEKASRIMEVLVSSIKPEIQMFGKIMGIALMGVTQYSIFALASILLFRQRYDQTALDIHEIPISTFVYAFVFFILGYLFYGLLLAMLASIVDRIEDVHMIVTPINLILIVGFIIASFGFVSPDSTFIQWVSYIPFFTPMLFFLRITLLDISPIEIISVIFVMILSIYFMGKMAARVYKGGVLTYGKGSIKHVFKLIKEGKE